MAALSRLAAKEACALFLTAYLLASCAYSEEKPQVVTATLTGTFSSLKSMIFMPKCASCHPNNSFSLFDVSDYTQVSGRVVSGNAGTSYLYRRVTDSAYGTVMPQGAPQLSGTEKQAIADWINNGAQNN